MFEYNLSPRKNSIHKWAPIDAEESYSARQPDGSPNYSTVDIEYSYNSDGFRCDEFSNMSDLPITFVGCSFTEGIGLPLNHCWPKFLIDIIKQQPGYENKSIPYHSVALSGSGVDTAANVLPAVAAKTNPKYIVGFFNSMYRRDYCVSGLTVKHWVHADAQDDLLKNEINRIFSDRYFALHQTYRSLKIIDLIAQFYGAKAFIMFADNGGEIRVPSDDFTSLKVNYCTINSVLSLPELQHTPKLARDNKRPGAKWQYTVATHIADTIIPPLNNKYQRFHNDDRNFVPCNVINPVAIKVFKQLPDKGWPV